MESKVKTIKLLYQANVNLEPIEFLFTDAWKRQIGISIEPVLCSLNSTKLIKYLQKLFWNRRTIFIIFSELSFSKMKQMKS